MAYKALARANVTIELFEDNERYEATVVSTNGVILQPYDSSTTLIGSVLKNGVDITSEIKNVRWTKWNPTADNLVECPEWNEKRIGYKVIEVKKDDVDNKSIFSFEAYNDNGDLLCTASISIIDINDLLVSTKEPKNPYIGQLWVDDSKSPANLYVWNGYKWVLAGAVGAVVKNLILNSSFTFNFDYWDIVGETKLSFTPYAFDYSGKRYLKLRSDVKIDTKRGISQTVTDGIRPGSEYSYQMLYFSDEESQAYSKNIFLTIFSIDKDGEETAVYEKVLTASRDIKRVYARFNSLENTVAIRIEICGENNYRYHFNFTEAALYNTHQDYPWTINPQDLKMYADHLTQEDLWNILSCNGTIQGIFSRINPETGQLEYYINASFIQAGKMKAEFMEMYNLKVLRKSDNKTTLEITDDGDVKLNVKQLIITSDDNEERDVNEDLNSIQFEISPEQFQVKVDAIATDENGKVTQHISSIATQTAKGFERKIMDEVDGKFTTIEETIDGITTQVGDLEGNLSTVEQTANKIGWIIKSGDSMSSMTLTDKAYELISKNVTIVADRIKLEGYTTINGGFAIDLEGNMYAKNGTFEGTIKSSKLETVEIETANITTASLTSVDITTANLNSTVIKTSDLYAPNIYSDDTDSPAFSLTSDGTLKAYNATISGNIEGAVLEAGTLKNKNGKFSVEADGVLRAEGAIINGDLTAGSVIKGATIIGSTIQNAEKNPTFTVTSDGTVTGAKLQGGSIGIGDVKDSDGKVKKYSAFTVDSSGNCNISKGSITIGSNFKVTNTGELTAKSASFTGNINSGSTIKGSTIIGTTIQNKDANPTFIVDKEGNVTGAKLTGGSIDIGNGKFKVDDKGNLTATSGSFTGTINSGTKIIGATIQNAEKNPTFTVDSNGNIKGGSININNAFTVDSNGKLTATDAVVTGKITATSGEIKGDTVITGDCITTGTISAARLALGDMTNYCELNETNYAEYGFTKAEDSNEPGNPWFKLKEIKRSIALVKPRDGSGYSRYAGNVAGTYRIQFDCASSVKGATTEGGSTIEYLQVNVGFYCKTKAGGNAYYIPVGQKTTSTMTTVSVDTSATLPASVHSFGVYLQVKGYAPFTGTVKIKNVRVTRMTDNALIVNGSITADHINGKTLTGVTLQNASGTFKVDANGNVTGAAISGSSITLKNDNGDTTFNVTKKGAVTASNIKITGGSLNINDAFKVNANGVLTATGATITGKITAETGTIGGYTISGNVLKSSTVGMCSKSGDEWAFWAGAAAGADSPFHVGHSGSVYASNIFLTGTIKNESDTFSVDKDGNIKGASLTSSSGGKNGNFSIDSEGNMDAANLAVDGEVSCDVLVCNEIRSKKYAMTLTSNCTLYVGNKTDSSGKVTEYGNDDNECKNNAYFATIQGAIDSIPKNLNGRTVTINVLKSTTGDVKINYFTSGRIYLYLNSKTITGHVAVYCCGASILIYGGASSSDTATASIKPITGSALGSRTCSISCDRSTYVYLGYLKVYAATQQASGCTSDYVGVGVSVGMTYCKSIDIYNVGVGFRTNSAGHIHMALSSGIASKYGFQSATGGKISFTDDRQAGGQTAATNKGSGGQIWYNNPTFQSGTPTTAPPTTTPTVTKKTKTFTSSAANAIQYYGQSDAKWRSDSKPKVGTWGYGPHTGWWFFDDDFESMAKKDVYQIDITFTRNSGGYHDATPTLNFYAHNYESQPDDVSPTYYATKLGSTKVKINTSGTIKITGDTLINAIKTRKGICSIPPKQNGDNYAVFSGTMKVKFYYEE